MENRISLGAKSRYSLDLETLEIIENEVNMKVAELGGQPIFTIAGTDFYVEIHSQTLIEVADPKNYLPVGDMSDMGDRYKFPYHPTYKNWPCELDDPRESIDVEVPNLITLDPEGIVRKHHIDPEELKGRKDMEFLNPNYEGFLARIAGKLPTIEIAGDEYVIDLENTQLRLNTDGGQQLSFNDMQKGCPLSDDFSYRFAYDMVGKKLVPIESASHDNAITVVLPDEILLDPVALARRLGYSDDHYIRDHPIAKKLVAVISMIKKAPLSDNLNTCDKKGQFRKKGLGI